MVMLIVMLLLLCVVLLCILLFYVGKYACFQVFISIYSPSPVSSLMPS